MVMGSEWEGGPERALAELYAMAERELAAFFTAVGEIFGPVQARAAAEEWIEEVDLLPGLPQTVREWRAVTAAAAARVAARVVGSRAD